MDLSGDDLMCARTLGGDHREQEESSGVLRLPLSTEQLWELVMGERPHDLVTVC